MESPSPEQKILAHLLRQFPNSEVSLIRHKNQVYFSSFPRTSWSPSSASIKLVQGLFDQHRDLSFFILRNRIYTSEVLTPFIRHLVKLTAKRISQIDPVWDSNFEAPDLIEIGHSQDQIYPSQAILNPIVLDPELPRIASQQEAFDFCQKILDLIPRGHVLHDHNRRVAAILVSAEGAVLEWSSNQAALNKSLHAELSLVQKFFKKSGKKIPAGSRIYVSLKPCLMCASCLREACEDFGSTQFFYFEEDPGSMAQRTELDSVLQKIISH